MVKYLVQRTENQGNTPYDMSCGEFDDLSKANYEAEIVWERLTKNEQNKCTVQVIFVKDEWLNDTAIDDDGINWWDHHSSSYDEGCFDSRKFE